jgi:Flp pilus assembly pilin Flp
MRAMTDLIARMLSRLSPEEGQGLTEYGLILAFVALGALASLGILAAIVAGYLGDIGAAFP